MYYQESSYTKPALNSKVSPFFGAANAPLILLTAITSWIAWRLQLPPHPSYVEASKWRSWPLCGVKDSRIRMGRERYIVACSLRSAKGKERVVECCAWS
jgi:hypothetical protein